MAKVKEGDTVNIHYTGKLEDGTIFDSSEGGAPLEFKAGGGEFLKGLEEGVIGMGIEMKRQSESPLKKDTAFIMDCNHPLAGKNLVFEIKLVEIA